MDLPKFNETFIPILEILSDEKIIRHRELLKQVEENNYSNLPQELLEKKTKSGEPLIRNRIAWGKSYLKKGGFVHYPERGMVQITPKGKEAKNKKLKLKDVESDFLSFYADEKTKDTNNKEIRGSSPQDLIDSGFSAIELQIKSDFIRKVERH